MLIVAGEWRQSVSSGQGPDTAPGTGPSKLERLQAENRRLRKLLGLRPDDPLPATADPSALELPLVGCDEAVDAHSSIERRIAVFRSLFRGRDDVYAVRWSNQDGRSGYVPAVAGGWRKDRPKQQRRYLPMTDAVLTAHLEGEETIGLYPLLEDDSCWLLAADFDGPAWRLDALAYLEAAAGHDLPAYLERSRSGNGGHVWIFFTEPVAASDARRLGTGLLRAAIEARAELDLASYDRLFPSQDLLPRGSFGNLIALPLQGRAVEQGNSLFLEPASLEPFEDQWQLLSQMVRVSPSTVDGLLRRLAPLRTGPDVASRWRRAARSPQAPAQLEGTVDAQLHVDKAGLSSSMRAALKHLASMQNPEFHKKQQLRLSTWQTPRIIPAYEEDLTHLHLPRGVQPELEQLAERVGSTLQLEARWPELEPLELEFQGELTGPQQAAVDDLLAHDLGMLVAPPGSGKTVMGCAIVAERQLPTLVLVYRKPLLEQWREQLATSLNLDPTEIGELAAGRDRRTGTVDLATVQTLARQDDVAGVTGAYGLLVVDECHHVPAVTIQRVVSQIPTRFVLGLTATPYRGDGLDPLIAMHCGPVRNSGDPAPSSLRLELEVHETAFALDEAEDAPIHEVLGAVAEDPERTRQIADDVAAELTAGRHCLVLSERKSHLAALAEQLRELGIDPLVLHGGMKRTTEQQVMDRLESAAEGPLVLAATGQYIGEGFDCPPLDTLFLTFPMSDKGKVVQRVGRIQRPFPGKHTARVHDYLDTRVPVLARMHTRRLKTYRTLGLTEDSDQQPQLDLDL